MSLRRLWQRLATTRNDRRIQAIKSEVFALRRQTAALLHLIGDQEARRVRGLPNRTPLIEAEFKIYSQFGQDGILQYLFSRIPSVNPTFIEFGVEDYSEASTRFLLLHDHFSGLVMDGRPDLAKLVADQGLPMMYPLEVVSAFISAENINGLITTAGFSGEVGVLAVDIDGNDYWVWKAITCIRPQIVVAEYNAIFGPHAAITVPYVPDFTRQGAHESWLYFGASLRALCLLAEEKGYVFAGCNAAGNDAFFVRKDLADPCPNPSPEAGFRDSQFRESRDRRGRMNLLAGPARLEAIGHLPVLDLADGQLRPLWEAIPPTPGF